MGGGEGDVEREKVSRAWRAEKIYREY